MRRTATTTTGLLIAPTLAVALLLFSGGLGAQPFPGLPDPGVLTRYGLPIVQAVRDLAAGLTVGALVLAACCVPLGADQRSPASDERGGGQRAVVRIGAIAAAVWLWCSLALIALSFSDADGSGVLSEGVLSRVLFFARSYELGRYLTASAVIAGLVLVGSLWSRRTVTVGLLAVLSIVGLWPIALGGHASGTLDHDSAVNLQAMHLLGVGVWAGGLGVLVIARRRLGADALPTVRHFSTLAGWCFALLTVSGVAGAALRLRDVGALDSSYGVLLLIKVVAVVVLGLLGWRQRRRLIDRFAAGQPGAFWRIAALEAVVMAVAAGAAVALSRTAPPGPDLEAALSTNEALLGYEMPPALGAAQWFTQWRPDLFWLPIAVLGLGAYLVGVRRLRARGDAWPVLQTVCWSIGCALLIWSTSGSPGAYSRVLFSMHMVQHMTVAMAVPVFLVLGAPVTLALRALPRRNDGSMGAREWLLRVVHSPTAYLLGHPIVASALFIVSLVTFYYSSLFELSLRAHTAHVLMVAHFLISGYLLANCLVGLDPGPRRPAFPMRALLLMITFGFHALFSVSLMASETVLAETWFTSLDRSWGASLLDDQYLGASIGWALGDYPLAILAGTLVALWVAADRRERRRFDRKADRDGDLELTDYNDYLKSLAQSRQRDADV